MSALARVRGRRSPAVQPISRLNEMMIEILVDLARRPDAPPGGYSIVAPLRAHFRSLDAPARRRLADLPFLLVDLRLADATIWASALRAAQRGVERRRRRTTHEECTVALARGTTLLAWHVVHSNAVGAAVHLGMSERVVELLRTADVLGLDAAAASLAPHCRPRWSDRPSAWAYLIAKSGSEASPGRDQTVYGLQLLGADLLTAPVSRGRDRRSAPSLTRSDANR